MTIACPPIETILKQSNRFRPGIFLARILLPVEFYLRAMLGFFTAFAGVLMIRVLGKGSRIASLFVAALSIVLALRGAGVRALAVHRLAAPFLNFLSTWRTQRWNCIATFNIQDFRKTLAFGDFVLAADVLNDLNACVHTLFIGMSNSSNGLGVYPRSVTA
ncbi:oligosaccharide flippase family protein [Dokdonella sp.]|uniref:oligosaccharide flippase family protein n=1 Tax=Dokdonella sp. TaxID=2291710 RepID=UPI002D7EB096|nr:oligosaccharide flippase family protein [Dokdonella sp.]